MSTRYYTEDTKNIPFRFLVHAISPMMPKPLAWVVAGTIRLFGKFGKGLPPAYGSGFPGSERVGEPGDLPASAIARWAPILEQLKDLDFEPLKCAISDTVGVKMNCSTLLLDPPGTTIAILEWSRINAANGIEEVTPLEFNSYRDDAPDIVTGVVRKIDVPMSEMLEIDSVEMISLEDNRPLAQRYQEHRDRCQGKRVLQMTFDKALEVARERAEKRFDQLLETGIIRELKPAEIEKLRHADLTELHNY